MKISMIPYRSMPHFWSKTLIATVFVLIYLLSFNAQKVLGQTCTKPNAGSDQTMAHENGLLPTTFDLIDADAGERWKIILQVPAGQSTSLASPTGTVTGTLATGVYEQKVIETDSENGFTFSNSKDITIKPLPGTCVTDAVCNIALQTYEITTETTGNSHSRYSGR